MKRILSFAIAFLMSTAALAGSQNVLLRTNDKLAQLKQSYDQKVQAIQMSLEPEWKKRVLLSNAQEEIQRQRTAIQERGNALYEQLRDRENRGVDSTIKIYAKRDNAIRDVNTWRDQTTTNIRVSGITPLTMSQKIKEVEQAADNRIVEIRTRAIAEEKALIQLQQDASKW